MVAEFSKELIGAARAYSNRDAIYHQHFAGNCIESPSERCLTDGMGPDAFDCSGLIIRSISDVTGMDISEQMRDSRHVRDMWRSALGQNRFYLTEFAVGALVVTRRHYTIGGEPVVVPGHIGIITRGDNNPDFIHANPRTGKVEEAPFRSSEAVLGYLAVNLSNKENQE